MCRRNAFDLVRVLLWKCFVGNTRVSASCSVARKQQSAVDSKPRIELTLSACANTPNTTFKQDSKKQRDIDKVLDAHSKLKHLLQRAVRTAAQQGYIREGGGNGDAAKGPPESELYIFTPRERSRSEPSPAEP